MKTLSVVGEVSWWYNEEGVYTLLFSYKLLSVSKEI
jgi:hypothetical protein